MELSRLTKSHRVSDTDLLAFNSPSSVTNQLKSNKKHGQFHAFFSDINLMNCIAIAMMFRYYKDNLALILKQV